MRRSTLLQLVPSLIVLFQITAVWATKVRAVGDEEIVKLIQSDSGLSKADAKRALDGFVNTTESALKKGERIALVGFGSFSISKRAAVSNVLEQGGPTNIEQSCLWLRLTGPWWLYEKTCTVNDQTLAGRLARLELPGDREQADGEKVPTLGFENALIVIAAVEDVTELGLKMGEPVQVTGFGTFTVRKRPGRGRAPIDIEWVADESFARAVAGRNPQTGKEIKIAAKNVVKFKAGAELAKKVN